MKKVMIRSEEDLDMMMKEIFVSSLFCHPNLLPLLDHAIIPVMVSLSHSLHLHFLMKFSF